MPPLDAIDRKILGALRQDGRMPNNRLARLAGLSPSACLRRVRILEETGVIRGYTVLVAEGAVEGGVVAIVRITLEKQTEELLNRFEQAARQRPQVFPRELAQADQLMPVAISRVAAQEETHVHARRFAIVGLGKILGEMAM